MVCATGKSAKSLLPANFELQLFLHVNVFLWELSDDYEILPVNLRFAYFELSTVTYFFIIGNIFKWLFFQPILKHLFHQEGNKYI